MIRVVVPADLDGLVRAVGQALDGHGPAVAPRPPLDDAEPPAGTALVLRTSGSTGTPRDVVLSAAALEASGDATHRRLGGPGHWVLTLPADHVAGVQVIARAHRAACGLTAADAGPFTAEGFAALVRRVPDGVRAYVSLVPTQLHRLVEAAEAGEGAGLDALARFDAVLVGGAATAPGLLARARRHAPIVTTYGMTETCGGCVYDGVPLDGVRVRITNPDGTTQPEGGSVSTGTIELSGPVLATGYLGRPDLTDATFPVVGGVRWFQTTDLGSLDDGRLTVLGRVDDVILSGGVNVAPAAVESVLVEVPSIAEACVVGVRDPEWGQTVVAVVTLRSTSASDGADGVPRPDADLLDLVRRRVTDTLGRADAPRHLLIVGEFPRRGPGKVDRSAVTRLATAHVAAGGA